VRSGVYPEMLHALRPGAEAETLACGRLVELAEEGKWDGAEAEATLTRTLGMLKPGFDTLVLGCTHFSLLAPALRKLLPPETALIDSAAVTARVVADFLRAHKLLDHKTGAGTSRFLATSEPERFARLARRFLNEDVAVERAALASTDKIVSITARRQ
jgi:glutamate racemase